MQNCYPLYANVEYTPHDGDVTCIASYRGNHQRWPDSVSERGKNLLYTLYLVNRWKSYEVRFFWKGSGTWSGTSGHPITLKFCMDVTY